MLEMAVLVVVLPAALVLGLLAVVAAIVAALATLDGSQAHSATRGPALRTARLTPSA
jgi:hypothetical protein